MERKRSAEELLNYAIAGGRDFNMKDWRKLKNYLRSDQIELTPQIACLAKDMGLPRKVPERSGCYSFWVSTVELLAHCLLK